MTLRDPEPIGESAFAGNHLERQYMVPSVSGEMTKQRDDTIGLDLPGPAQSVPLGRLFEATLGQG